MKHAYRQEDDQATGLYLLRQKADEHKADKRITPLVRHKPALVIAITSGKGGVGKSTICGNLAAAIAKTGAQVLAIDADLGLADLNFVFGIHPVHTLADVVSGAKSTLEIVTQGPAGVHVLAAYHGSFELANLGDAQRAALFAAIDTLPNQYDVVLVDTGAGLHSSAVWFAAASTHVVLVMTRDPTSIADAYAMMKVLKNKFSIRSFYVVVNMVESALEAESIFSKFEKLTTQFLSVKVTFLGYVYEDSNVDKALLQAVPFVMGHPQSSASRCIESLANRILSEESKKLSGGIQLFWQQLSEAANK